MRRRVEERERNWECRDRAGEGQELTKSQWQEAMGLGGDLQSWENFNGKRRSKVRSGKRTWRRRR
jgi:hypothetical protein